MRYRYILLFICSFLCSCRENNKQNNPIDYFTESVDLFHKNLNVDPYKLGSPGKMIMFDNNEFLIKEESRDGFNLSKIYYNKDSIIQLAPKGNGPNEFLKLTLMQKDTDTSFYAFDVLKRQIYNISIDNAYKYNCEIDVYSTSVINLDQYYLSQGINVNNPITNNSRFTVFSLNGRQCKTFGSFPKDKISTTVENKQMAYQGKMVVNKNLNRFAFTTFSSAVFEIYELDSLIVSRHDRLPQYTIKSGSNILGVVYSSDNKRGYIDSYSTSHFIYTLYSGKSPKDILDGNFDKTSLTRIILVYDWDGKPICRLNTDIDLRNICVSEDNSYMIGLACENDYSLCFFDLSGVNSLK